MTEFTHPCRKRATEEQKKLAIQLYESGKEMREIAEMLGFNTCSVWDWIKKKRGKN